MAYFLWRGGVLRGRIHLVFPSRRPGLVAGMLHPTADYEHIEPIVQLRLKHLPGSPVLQQSIPESAPERRSTRKTSVLRKLSAEEAAGVDPSRVLELRDRENEPLELDMLSIERVSSSENRGKVRSACEELGIEFSPWYLIGSVIANPLRGPTG